MVTLREKNKRSYECKVGKRLRSANKRSLLKVIFFFLCIVYPYYIIGVGAEGYSGPELVTIGKCNIFKIGHCSIEKLEEELPSRKVFKENNIDLLNSFDVMVTNWCSRHLVDPVGLIPQIGTFLKSGTGLFFGDGFFYGLEGYKNFYNSTEESIEVHPNDAMTMLLLDMKVPFLIHPYNNDRSLNRFVFKKNIDGPINLPLEYVDMISLDKWYTVESKAATVFRHIGPLPQWDGETPIAYKEQGNMVNKLCGDFNLFSFFKDNKLFCREFGTRRMRKMEHSILELKK